MTNVIAVAEPTAVGVESATGASLGFQPAYRGLGGSSGLMPLLSVTTFSP